GLGAWAESGLPFNAGGHPIAKATLLAYARENRLEMLVGQYDPASRRYLSNTYAFVPPDVHAAFTLYGPRGKIQAVHLDENFPTRPDEQPWDWSVAISPWDRKIGRAHV